MEPSQMRTKTLLKVIAPIASALANPAVVHAQTVLYATDTSTPPKLHTITVETGAVTEIGMLGIPNFILQIYEHLAGLAFGPDGTLYGYSMMYSSARPSVLYSIDTGTGSATQIGPMDVPVYEGGMTFASDGTLFVTTGRTAADPWLLEVDPDTGAAQELLPLLTTYPGVPTQQGELYFADLSGIATRSDGKLVGIDTLSSDERLVVIDPIAGFVDELALIDSGRDGVTAGMTMIGDTGYFVFGNSAFPFDDELWSFDPFTGEQTFIASLGNYRFQSLAAKAPPPPCPADIDGDRMARAGDILDYLQLWVVADPAADVTRDGLIQPDDIDAFLGLWDDGCP